MGQDLRERKDVEAVFYHEWETEPGQHLILAEFRFLHLSVRLNVKKQFLNSRTDPLPPFPLN
jgi:hypothetical protein